jgi:hypothetical protein
MKPLTPHELLHWFGVRITELFANALKNGISLRGAVSLGSFFETDHAVVGKAISDAGSIHEEAAWAGVVLSPNSIDELNKSDPNCSFCNRFWPTYDVPMTRERLALTTRALAWPRFFPQALDPSMTRENVGMWLKKRPADKSALIKIENTLSFFDAMVLAEPSPNSGLSAP